jgi:hypothetical protein
MDFKEIQNTLYKSHTMSQDRVAFVLYADLTKSMTIMVAADNQS